MRQSKVDNNVVSQAEFLKSVKSHQMEIIRDDGVYRHIRFKQRDTSIMYFDLITWPGHLCFTGDMGSFLFSRVRDMFNFFRVDNINPQYWQQKLLSVDAHSTVENFDEEVFNREAKREVVAFIKDHRDCMEKADRKALWEALHSDVLQIDPGPQGYEKQRAAYYFEHRVNGDALFCFGDDVTWFTSFSHEYLWCCQAIVWGISKYDEHRAAITSDTGKEASDNNSPTG